MKRLDASIIETVAETICGSSSDEEQTFSPTGTYRTMSEIRAFFEHAGIKPSGQSSTRKRFVVESLESVNGTTGLERILSRLSSPLEYQGDSTLTHRVIGRLNNALRLEGLEIVLEGVGARIRECTPTMGIPTPTIVRRTPRTLRLIDPPKDEGSPTNQSSEQEQASEILNSASSRAFIGHGHSPVWRELKDFLQERVGLTVDEFSRVSNAGRPTTERLAEMLDSATVAFLLMTGEDETAGGKTRARENVVHEVGLFQGRLGFTRAIVLLQDECEEFSNIVGLGQIRFRRDNISSAYEEIRMFLERENIISEE